MKKYTELEVVQKITEVLSKAMDEAKTKKKNRKIAEKVLKDLEDPDMKSDISSDELPASSQSAMHKAKIDDYKYGKEKGGDSSIAVRARKHNDRQDRAEELGEADRERFKNAKTKLKEKKIKEAASRDLEKCGEITKKSEKPLAGFMKKMQEKNK